MPFPDNRIDQSKYKSEKGLSSKVYCQSCRTRQKGLMYINANGKTVCESCAGRSAQWRLDGSQT